uniref:transposase n=1 Tax=Streptomyces polyasparticus TaxID=2767826 RepID=UPI00280B70FF|nr:transposase [Streptomyces polyasparticus]
MEVARQCCGAVVKRATCQVVVSVHAATDTASCPLDWQLYLPEEWTSDAARRRSAGVPCDVTFAAKTQLALDRLAAWDLSAPVAVTDCGHGRSVASALHWKTAAWTIW